jgi:hypothetical protein
MKPSHARQAIKFLAERKRPAFIWGPPGVGKSDTVAQVAENMSVKLIDIRLSLLDSVDLKGFPQPNGKVMSWLPPDFLPRTGKGILFLDEMNSAPASVQAAAYQLILNRRIGDYELPKDWAIMAAGNRSTDRSVVHAMPAALANRFVHIEFEADVDDWLDWALANGISDLTRGYIRYREKNLTTDKLEAGMKAFPSPRSWAFADQIVGSKLPIEIEMEMLEGTVGKGVAIEYLGFCKEAENIPSIDKILLDPAKTKVPESPSTKYAVVAMLESKATPDNLDRLMKYTARLEKDFEVKFMSSLAKREDCDELVTTGAFIEWARANRSVVL